MPTAKKPASSTKQLPRSLAKKPTRPTTTTRAGTTAGRQTSLGSAKPPVVAQPAVKVAATRPPRRSAKRHTNDSLGARLRGLSRTSWVFLITGAIITGLVAFALYANNQPSTPTSGGVGCGVTYPPVNQNFTKSDWLTAGKTAPPLGKLYGSDCAQYSLAQYSGKVVLLELFAPWCPHCRNETATLNQLQGADASKGFQVLSVSASPYYKDYEATGKSIPIGMADIQWFHSAYNLKYPALFDPAMTVANTYGLVNNGYPSIFLINKQGVITYTESGEVAYDQLQSEITTALNS